MKIKDARIISSDNLKSLSQKLKLESKKTVFVIGSWDMLHIGQARFLMNSKKRGDVLIVGVLGNDLAAISKGNDPVLGEQIRAEMILHLKCTDYATIIDKDIQTTIDKLTPDLIVLSHDRWNEDQKIFNKIKSIKAGVTKVELVERKTPFISSTIIMRKVTSAKLDHVFKSFLKLRKKPLREEKLF